MKLIRLTVFTVILIFCSNCTEDKSPLVDSENSEEPKPNEDTMNLESEVYFTYTSALGNEIDEWIMVYNQNGDLLDSKLIENNETYDFKTKDIAAQISDKITVTRLTSSADNINLIITFTDINKGSIWNSPPGNATVNEPITGKFSISVDNAPNYKSFTLSTSMGTVSNFDSIESSNLPSNSFLRLNGVPLFEDQGYFLSFFTQQGEHRYVYLENPTNNMQYDFDYSELLLFDNYLEIDFPNNTSRSIIRGYKEPINYMNNKTVLGDASEFGSTPYQLGYSDIFEKFKTSVFMNIDGDEYIYIKMGDKLDEINIPSKPLVEIDDNTVNNFEFSSDQNFVRKSTRWITPAVFPNITPTITWTVISSNSKFHDVPMLPFEILDQYPNLELDQLKLLSLQLFLQSGEYQSYFDSNFESYKIKEDLIQESFTYYFEQ